MIRELVTLIYLSTAGFIDYKKRTIPIFLPCIGTMFGIFLYFFQKDLIVKEMLIAMIPGFVFLAISLATSGRVGIGDGLIIIPFGMLAGFWDSTISLIYAMIFSGTVALFLLATRRRSGNYQLPFLPFLLCGLVLNLLTKKPL